ncbi:MAG: hypothetical protein M5U26_06215 [Planctomycetota bacterium]|nr:hypothetical protein [Planctomycetota bacterium]
MDSDVAAPTTPGARKPADHFASPAQPEMVKRPWFQLHLLPMMFVAFGVSCWSYAWITFEVDTSAGNSKDPVWIVFLGSVLLIMGAIKEARLQRHEDRLRDSRFR